MLINAAQHNTTQHNAAQHNTTQHNTTQHNTTQHNTTQHVDYLGQRLFVKSFFNNSLSFLGNGLFFVPSRKVVA